MRMHRLSAVDHVLHQVRRQTHHRNLRYHVLRVSQANLLLQLLALRDRAIDLPVRQHVLPVRKKNLQALLHVLLDSRPGHLAALHQSHLEVQFQDHLENRLQSLLLDSQQNRRLSQLQNQLLSRLQSQLLVL